MSKHIELIDDYIIQQGKESDYNPPSYIWNDNKGELIRCKNCKHWRSDSDLTCRYYGGASPRLANDYCSRAVRKEVKE